MKNGLTLLELLLFIWKEKKVLIIIILITLLSGYLYDHNQKNYKSILHIESLYEKDNFQSLKDFKHFFLNQDNFSNWKKLNDNFSLKFNDISDHTFDENLPYTIKNKFININGSEIIVNSKDKNIISETYSYSQFTNKKLSNFYLSELNKKISFIDEKVNEFKIQKSLYIKELAEEVAKIAESSDTSKFTFTYDDDMSLEDKARNDLFDATLQFQILTKIINLYGGIIKVKFPTPPSKIISSQRIYFLSIIISIAINLLYLTLKFYIPQLKQKKPNLSL